MNWDKIRAEYESTDITLKALADKHEIKLGTLKSRKSREKWGRDATEKKDATNRVRDATPPKKMQGQPKEEKPVFVESEGLTDKQRLFCMYYVKSFNATQSAIKAGYSADTAHVQGPRLLGNVRVGDEIRRIKGKMHQGLFIDAMDVLNKYVQIAFADIADYADFGMKEVAVDIDENGEEVMAFVNFVDFKNAQEVDGTIISEIKKGKDGISVKLADKMKALEKLEQYFDLLPDHHKRKMEEEKLKIKQRELELKNPNTEEDEYEDDGFMDAINGAAEAVWGDEKA